VSLWRAPLQRTATHCNALQRTATHCNALQRTATHCNALQCTATHCNALQHTATHCNTLQHTATHCNTQQRTATHCKPPHCSEHRPSWRFRFFFWRFRFFFGGLGFQGIELSSLIFVGEVSGFRVYGVATISRLLQIIGLSCRISSLL